MAFLKKDNIKLFLVISIIIVAVMLMLSILVLNFQYGLYEKSMYDSLGAIVNVAVKHGPEAETEIIQAIKEISTSDIEEGKQILTKYGISKNSTEGISIISTLISVNKTINILLIVLGCTLLIITFIIFISLRERRLKNITKYLKNLQDGIFSLKVEENTEGELSELQNQIAKITTMLQTQAKIMKKDKIELNTALSDISHQIKTPLTSINVMLDIVKEPNLDETTKIEYLHEITKQLNSINWLVTELLKLSRLDSGVVQFQNEQINLEELIKEVQQKMAIPLELKNQTLETDIQKNSQMQGDYNWTKEAITNILKNCIEHTRENKKIQIHITENTLYTQITIKDQGEGISENDLPYIFNRFYKGKGSYKESFGIGLALAKSIIEKQNGEIKVQSKLGEGTEFRIQMFKGVI